MIQEHFDAVKTRLNADSALNGRGFDSVRRNPDGGLVRDTYWVLLGGGPDSLNDNRQSARQRADSEAEFVYTLRCVSVTPGGVRAQAGKAMLQLIGFKPVIAGRKCEPITYQAVRDVTEDTGVKPSLFYSDDEYTLTSQRA